MPTLSEEQWQPIDVEIRADRMIAAIKAYRAATGEGLKEAKDAVEARLLVLAGIQGRGQGGTVESSEGSWEAVDAEILAGRNIQAIKLYRGTHGGGLKEAKEAVEARASELRKKMPEKFAPAGKAGCMGVILVMIGVLFGLKSFA